MCHFSLDMDSGRCYCSIMAKETATRIGINLKSSDRAALRRVIRSIEAKHGEMTITAAIRYLIHEADIRRATAQKGEQHDRETDII